MYLCVRVWSAVLRLCCVLVGVVLCGAFVNWCMSSSCEFCECKLADDVSSSFLYKRKLVVHPHRQPLDKTKDRTKDKTKDEGLRTKDNRCHLFEYELFHRARGVTYHTYVLFQRVV